MWSSRRGKPKQLHQVEFTAKFISSSQRSSKESRQTGRKTKSKCMDKRRLRSGFQVFLCAFCGLGHQNRWKWGPGARPGPGWHPDTKKHVKRVWIWSGFDPRGGSFSGCGGTFRGVIFCVFLEHLFFASRVAFGRPRCRKGWQKAPQSNEKGGPRTSSGAC